MAYLRCMAKPLHHPAAEAIDLSAVLEALSDPLRRAMVLRLSQQGETRCGTIIEAHGTTKTNLSYHLARLREAGLVRVRVDGPYRHVSLRQDEVDGRFPGLLGAVLNSARRECTAQPVVAGL